MSYTNNYNYQLPGLHRIKYLEHFALTLMADYRAGFQVAVIFAILLGGVLLLALVVGGIYFVCVSNMRDDDKKRLHSGRNSAAWPGQQAPSYSSAPYRAAPTTAVLTAPTPPQQSYDFAPRGSAAQSPMGNVAPQQYSSQVPLVMPARVEEFGPPAHYRPLQPDVIYTQNHIKELS
ncbi:unnamed protein product [Cylicostephanus goldi]|uniref:Uncharacterized protein n=1 Tax=Cylicostephanus goldi TaxID=71465 RepID=A0A3P7LSV0_CYLGO|nr:unnamed protein product [Cylicostephanus goldi]